MARRFTFESARVTLPHVVCRPGSRHVSSTFDTGPSLPFERASGSEKNLFRWRVAKLHGHAHDIDGDHNHHMAHSKHTRISGPLSALGGALAAAVAAAATLLLVTTSATAAPPGAATSVVDQALDAAKQASASVAELKVAVDTVWVLVAAFLVFFMNLGFAMVESGLNRAKNCVNILAKNFVVFAVSTLGFLFVGWGLMFGDGNGFFGTHGLWMASGLDNSPATGDAYHGVYSSIAWTGVPFWAKFFFQLVFCGTAATIVSGAVAERIKFGSFILFSLLLTGIVYPIVGHTIWGGGLLGSAGMLDFAGSTVVHSVGGWAALAGVIVLGARKGKYGADGKVTPIPGHSMTSVTLGGLVLWFGWFGFNPGSTMAADGASIAHIAVTTNSAAAAATLSATVTAWLLLGKPDLSMIVNGTLAGLVAITAPCAFVSVPSSLLIGVIAGVIVVFAVIFFDKMKLDDPVGALAVHLANGVFGTLAVGLFANPTVCPAAAVAKKGLLLGGGFAQFGPQLKGVALSAVITFGLSLAFWLVIKATMGVRVSAEEELEGLDVGEHGMEAYPEFRNG
jgi:Amt family ammonium transporter